MENETMPEKIIRIFKEILDEKKPNKYFFRIESKELSSEEVLDQMKKDVEYGSELLSALRMKYTIGQFSGRTATVQRLDERAKEAIIFIAIREHLENLKMFQVVFVK